MLFYNKSPTGIVKFIVALRINQHLYKDRPKVEQIHDTGALAHGEFREEEEQRCHCSVHIVRVIGRHAPGDSSRLFRAAPYRVPQQVRHERLLPLLLLLPLPWQRP